MFPLDAMSHSLPAHQQAGRLGVDVLGLLWPLRGAAGGEGVRLYASADLARPLDIDALFAQRAPARVPRAALRDHLLVVRPRGEFFGTDELALSQMRWHDDRWSIDLEITRCENQDGEPAPRDLYVVLCVNMGNRPLRSLALQYSGRRRDFKGNETQMAEPVAPAQLIEFS